MSSSTASLVCTASNGSLHNLWCGLLLYPVQRQCEKPHYKVKTVSSHTLFFISFHRGIRGHNFNHMINQLITTTLRSLSTYGIPSSHNQLRELYQYTCSHLSQLDKICDYYMAGAIFSIMGYEKLGLGHAPRLAYICLTSGAETNKNAIAERLKLVMNGGMQLLEEKVHLFTIPGNQVIDFAILADVLELQRQHFHSSERWWKRVVEDAQRIRRGYMQYSDYEIIVRGNKIHRCIAASVKDYLIQYFGYH